MNLKDSVLKPPFFPNQTGFTLGPKSVLVNRQTICFDGPFYFGRGGDPEERESGEGYDATTGRGAMFKAAPEKNVFPSNYPGLTLEPKSALVSGQTICFDGPFSFGRAAVDIGFGEGCLTRKAGRGVIRQSRSHVPGRGDLNVDDSVDSVDGGARGDDSAAGARESGHRGRRLASADRAMEFSNWGQGRSPSYEERQRIRLTWSKFVSPSI